MFGSETELERLLADVERAHESAPAMFRTPLVPLLKLLRAIVRRLESD